MKNLPLIICLFTFSGVFAQPNCEAYKYFGETKKYEACEQAMKIRGHYQFSREYQTYLDESLAIDSTFDYAYWAKSIAYLKSGDFITWKKLIDKAVEYNPIDHLGYRGWCRYQFFGDYEGAIADIEALDSLVDHDIGLSQNGTYHLNIAKGLCYKAIGQSSKAIAIIENQIALNEAENFLGPYDYLHLGVLYLEAERLEEAKEVLMQQSATNELAENQYYLALVMFKFGNRMQYNTCLKKAKDLYLVGSKMSDPYYNPMDKIYIEDIEKELKLADSND